MFADNWVGIKEADKRNELKPPGARSLAWGLRPVLGEIHM